MYQDPGTLVHSGTKAEKPIPCPPFLGPGPWGFVISKFEIGIFLFTEIK